MSIISQISVLLLYTERWSLHTIKLPVKFCSRHVSMIVTFQSVIFFGWIFFPNDLLWSSKHFLLDICPGKRQAIPLRSRDSVWTSHGYRLEWAGRINIIYHCKSCAILFITCFFYFVNIKATWCLIVTSCGVRTHNIISKIYPMIEILPLLR